ncbi:uncharacterized protein [Ptychodera flava]|uniref:uncharacterized protein n=1 Tax=Ptychodera flava TaxID=63121 RepID=UPI003969E60B
MRKLPDLSSLNTPQGLKPVMEKLPKFVLNKWRDNVASYKRRHKTFPPFKFFKDFLKDTAKAACDPDIPRPDDTPPGTSKSKSSQQTKTRARVHATKSSNEEKQCLFHEATGHDLKDCKAFAKQPVADRIELCKKKGLCFKCTEKHLAKDCTSTIECAICKSKKHITCLHATPGDRSKQKTTEAKPEDKEKETQEATTKCTRLTKCPAGRSCGKIVLAKVYTQDRPADYIETYVVLDDQSNACMGDSHLFDALKIHGPDLEYELSTCSGKGELRKGRRSNRVIIESHDGKKKFSLPVLLENDNIPSDKNEIPTPDICKTFKHLKPIIDYIPEPKKNVGIHLLIGRNCPEPLKRTPYDEQKAPSIEDKQFLDIMQREVHVNEEGNLELPLPFRQDPKKLPNNRQSALNRFYNLQNQFQRKPQMMEEYFQFMKKITERDHASPVPEDEIDADNAWYLPHFGVYHPKKQQIRVVFDSSAKYNGVS